MILRRQSTGEAVILSSKPLGRGGEAQVYPVASDLRLVAKVYHNPTATHARKLALMVARPWPVVDSTARHPAIAWPLDSLVTDDKSHRVVGFLMWRVNGMVPIHHFYTPQTRRIVCPKFDYRYLHRIARNIAAVVHSVHKHGYIIGDINESGVLGQDAALITLVDVDSFQVRDPNTGSVYRCGVGKPDFTPPELQGKNLSKVDRSEAHDHFGLAVIIFRLLMEGTHPFDGKFEGCGDPPPLESRISSGQFPHGRKRVPWSPKPVAPPFGILHPKLKQLFIRCFEDGHHDSRARPVAQSWERTLEEAEDALVECRNNSQHAFGDHLGACPWCKRKALFGGLDPFPQPSSSQPKRYPRPARRQMARASGVGRVTQYCLTQRLLRGRSRTPVGLIILLTIVGIMFLLAKT
jgi:DNA-binding helix-hairpin-helix protein with protein kinase domain